MHEHDNDLIMALAEGSLHGPDAAAAAASIAACARCSEELAFQRDALAALSSLTPPRLTELESARLRRDIGDALGHARTAAAPRRRRVSLKPLVGIAAALLAVVVAVPTLRSLGSGDDDADITTAAADVSREAADDASTEEMAASDLAAGTTAAPAAAGEPADGGADDAPELMMASTAPGAGSVASPEMIQAELGDFQKDLATALAEDGMVAPEVDVALAVLGEEYVAVDADAGAACASGLGFDGAAGEVVALGEVEFTATGEHLVIEIHPTEAGPVVVALAAETCDVVAISGP